MRRDYENASRLFNKGNLYYENSLKGINPDSDRVFGENQRLNGRYITRPGRNKKNHSK